jgi:hypothetical protein
MSKEAATALFLCTSIDLVVVRKLSMTLSDEIRIVVNIIQFSPFEFLFSLKSHKEELLV